MINHGCQGCEITDWNGTWFALFAPNGPFAGQGIIVLRSPSPIAANIWIDHDDDPPAGSNPSSIILRPPAGGFSGDVRERELLCFFDATTWTPSLTLPPGCVLDLPCNGG